MRGGSSAWSARRGSRCCSRRARCSCACLRKICQISQNGCWLLVYPQLELGAQVAHQPELGLEVDVVRQLQVLNEAGGLHVVAVTDHEFLVLGRGDAALAELL